MKQLIPRKALVIFVSLLGFFAAIAEDDFSVNPETTMAQVEVPISQVNSSSLVNSEVWSIDFSISTKAAPGFSRYRINDLQGYHDLKQRNQFLAQQFVKTAYPFRNHLPKVLRSSSTDDTPSDLS
ncbi:MAG: hypothetical protein AAFX87_28135 [Bacteroidota bacterium]